MIAASRAAMQHKEVSLAASFDVKREMNPEK